jgi:hypothetical protein
MTQEPNERAAQNFLITTEYEFGSGLRLDPTFLSELLVGALCDRVCSLLNARLCRARGLLGVTLGFLNHPLRLEFFGADQLADTLFDIANSLVGYAREFIRCASHVLFPFGHSENPRHRRITGTTAEGSHLAARLMEKS